MLTFVFCHLTSTGFFFLLLKKLAVRISGAPVCTVPHVIFFRKWSSENTTVVRQVARFVAFLEIQYAKEFAFFLCKWVRGASSGESDL